MFLPALHMYFGISLLIVWFGYQGIGPTVMVVFNNKNVTYYIFGGGGVTVFSFYITKHIPIYKYPYFNRL